MVNGILIGCFAGLFSNHGPLYFVNTKMSFSKMGLACHIAKIHSEVSLCFLGDILPLYNHVQNPLLSL